MEPIAEQLVMYGEPSNAASLEWSWVEHQLTAAGTYWVVLPGDGPPHPRPVWGVWNTDTLHLSVGSPVIARRLDQNSLVTVHLDSGTDVVILEGQARCFSDDPAIIEHYNRKYDWNYTTAEYGPLTTVSVTRAIAWQSAGWAGREGFQRTGRWRFDGSGATL